METQPVRCVVCDREFVARFRFQVRASEGRVSHVCSQTCAQRREVDRPECSVCSAAFVLEYPFQMAIEAGERRYFCSVGCQRLGARARSKARRALRIAVFNHKGGTGKTTTAVNLAAGLAETGQRVLLVDADGQGNVGASLGIRGEQTLYHVLVMGKPVEEVAVPVRNNLDVLTSNELLAAAELYLAGRPNRHRVLRDRLGPRVDGYDVVVLDCAPALSLMNQNALVFTDQVLVPVSCDYLSLVGMRQVLGTMKDVREHLHHDAKLAGVLPTFFDTRNRIARETVRALEEHFGDRCLPAIRVNTKLREAPGAKQTIFEYAPESHGAADYLALVERIRQLTAAEAGDDAANSAAEVAARSAAVNVAVGA